MSPRQRDARLPHPHTLSLTLSLTTKYPPSIALFLPTVLPSHAHHRAMHDISQLSSMRLRGGADVTEKVCIYHLCAFMHVCMCASVYVRMYVCALAPVLWC